MSRKQVYIQTSKNTHFVMVKSRNKFQRHSVAQFYAPDNSIEFVKQWIKENNYEEVTQ